MTKAFLLAGIAGALALTTLPALAQQGPSRPDDRDGYSDRGGRDQGSWRDGPWRGGGDRGGWHDMARGDDHEMRGGGRGGRHRGARFMVRSGDAAVAVRCDAEESMRSCLDATLTLLERARGLSPGGAGGSAGSGSGPSPAPSQPRQ